MFGCFDNCQSDDLPIYFNKVNSYLKSDSDIEVVKAFYLSLIDAGKVDEHSFLLSKFYWSIKDYESYKNTIMNAISKPTPLSLGSIIYDLKKFQLNLCEYYKVKGIENRRNAVRFIYSLILSFYFEMANDLMMFENNFTKFQNNLKRGKEMKFFLDYDPIKKCELIKTWFENNSSDTSKCLKALNSNLTTDEIVKLIQLEVFSEFPKQLGFKCKMLLDECDILNFDIKAFCLSFFNFEDFQDILVLSEKVHEWKLMIAVRTVDFASDGANSILKKIINM
ncbi:MAG: hypothetical protein IPN36_16445 [Bacteroidetes bacterium]|nr:hypothetical protein [Bacteroidota bacterium]